MTSSKRIKRDIIISILIILLIACLVYLGFQCFNNQKLSQQLATQKEEIDKLDFQNGAYKISLDDNNNDNRIEELKKEIIVKDLIIEYEKDEIRNMVYYIKFMQELCENNKLQYPYYVPVGAILDD